MFPDADEQRAHSPAMWDYFLTAGLRYGSVQIAGPRAAAAIRTPPGLPPIDAVHPAERGWYLGVVGTRVATDGPVVTTMWRPAR